MRLAAVPRAPAAAYFTVHGGTSANTLLSVSTDVAIKAEMHQSMSADAVSSMKPIDTLPVPARGTVAFAPGEACCAGRTLLARRATAAASTDVQPISRVSDSVVYEGPRGVVRVRDRHLQQRIYLARADGLEFDVLAEINRGF